MRGPRTEPTRARRPIKRESDNTESGDQNLSSPTASSCLPHLGRKRFHLHTKSPFYREPAPADVLDSTAPLHFTSRGTFNPEKGRQKLKNVKQSPQKPRDTPESGEQRILGSDGSSQSLVLFGSNEFMVWTKCILCLFSCWQCSFLTLFLPRHVPSTIALPWCLIAARSHGAWAASNLPRTQRGHVNKSLIQLYLLLKGFFIQDSFNTPCISTYWS